MNTWNIITPLSQDASLEYVKVGDVVEITGTIYTARDMAHKRLVQAKQSNQELPFDLAGQAVFFVGPTPPPPGYPIGSAGPTTSGRMDIYSPILLDHGLKIMIGKGPRSKEVVKSIIKNRALYLIAVGGVGALLSKHIQEASVVAYSELGPEAVRKLRVEKFPTIVGIDTQGNDIYEKGPKRYLDELK